MKTYRWFFLILVVSTVLVSCGGDEEEDLVGNWERRSIFPESGRSHAATFVIGDEGYVVGGTNGSGVKAQRNDVHVFYHKLGAADQRGGKPLGEWRTLKPFPGAARQQAAGFSANGMGYVGTGWAVSDNGVDMETKKDFWRYNPADDSWTEIAPLPDIAKPRRGAIAFSLKNADGKEYGYVGFGYEDEPGKNYLLDIYRYDPDANEWTAVYGYSGGKRANAAVFVIDNRAYICNGANPGITNEFYRFDPNAAGAEWTELRRTNPANPDEDFDDEYSFLGRSNGVAYVALTGGQMRGHVVGGNSGQGAATNWEYSHDEDLWVERTSFVNNAYALNREGMISFSFADGTAFVGLGKTGSAFYDDMWEFFPLEEDYTYNDGQ